MRVICKKSMMGNDVRCQVCGQGFVVFWQGRVQVRQMERQMVLQHLRMQHEHAGDSAEVHPSVAFDVPLWDGGVLGETAGQQRSSTT